MKTKILLSVIITILLAALVFPALANIASAAASNGAGSDRTDLEEQLLRATVRIKVESWVVRLDESGYDIDASTGHGTVTGGRFLITHNHFSVPLSILNRQANEASYGLVYLYDSRGNLLHKGPLLDFVVAREEMETLVLAHKEAGFFETLGFTSAAIGTEAFFAPGMEVAQVDWDGAKARIDWVQVKQVILEGGAPRLVLDDGVLPGASGGGIFLAGKHVANNWRLEEKIDGAGIVVQALTAAALNPQGMANLR